MIHTERNISPENIKPLLKKFWELSGDKIRSIEKNFDFTRGAPVFTVQGKYKTRGWTEWTLGFHYGSALLDFEMTGETDLLDIGKSGTLNRMAEHLSHTGVHDHGFNTISTYGNLLRLMEQNKIKENEWEANFYKLALKISGAVQASRWTELKDGGFIYSFNGPHSLFIDTIRSVRILVLSHLLKHELMGENDERIVLLERAVNHLKTTATYSVYYGRGKDRYDIPGRIAHEVIFNIRNGSYRGPSSQQGYSGRTTWMRGLAWALLGFTEELEFFSDPDFNRHETSSYLNDIKEILLKAAIVSSDFYIEHAASDGIPYWDSGAPGLAEMKNYPDLPADPFNAFEPVDSSAAVIACQGLLRLGHHFEISNQHEKARKYLQAGFTISKTIFSEPYLAEDPQHQGMILHSIYHYPNSWDYQPEKDKVPYGESSLWGDYHARELAVYLENLFTSGNYYTFYNYIK